jgi:ribosomal protein S12 methylthiotransferase accessory factor
MDVMRLCDGTRAWPQVVDLLARSWASETVASFMRGLASEHVLVESTQLWAHWSEVAQLPEPTCTTAGDEEILAMPQQAHAQLAQGTGSLSEDVRAGINPVARVLSLRKTARTFDDNPITTQTLCSILWAAHGVVSAADTVALGWHRTTASAGNMHSARWFVAVLQDLPSEARASEPGTQPGLYEAVFHTGRGTTLHPMKGHVLDVWRCLADPRALRFASAVVFPVYDIAVPGRKYGNRATLFANLEAGQSLQNAQLMAASLETGCMMRGDTVASEVIDLLELDTKADAHWLAMPALVLGVRPSDLQSQQQRLDKQFRVLRNLQPPTPGGMHMTGFAVTTVKLDQGSWVGGRGRANDPLLALTKAEAEAWERMGWANARGLAEARAEDLDAWIAPCDLVAYSTRQYASRSFPFAPFSPQRTYLWKKASDTATGQATAVLAECVHPLSALPEAYRPAAYTLTSTSGVAAGTSVEDALMRATLELIERDSFLCAWLSGLAPVVVASDSLPQPIQRRLQELREAGLETKVLDLSNQWSPVLAIFAQSKERSFTTVAAAASYCRDDALIRTLEEVEGRFAQIACGMPPRSVDLDCIGEVERYYRAPRTYGQSDFFSRSNAVASFSEVGASSPRTWSATQSRLTAAGLRLLSVDIAPIGAAIHQGRTPLHVVRALVPGLIPIWFHRGTQPEGMPRFKRAAGIAGGRPAAHFFHPFT